MDGLAVTRQWESIWSQQEANINKYRWLDQEHDPTNQFTFFVFGPLQENQSLVTEGSSKSRNWLRHHWTGLQFHKTICFLIFSSEQREADVTTCIGVVLIVHKNPLLFSCSIPRTVTN